MVEFLKTNLKILYINSQITISNLSSYEMEIVQMELRFLCRTKACRFRHVSFGAHRNDVSVDFDMASHPLGEIKK